MSEEESDPKNEITQVVQRSASSAEEDAGLLDEIDKAEEGEIEADPEVSSAQQEDDSSSASESAPAPLAVEEPEAEVSEEADAEDQAESTHVIHRGEVGAQSDSEDVVGEVQAQADEPKAEDADEDADEDEDEDADADADAESVSAPGDADAESVSAPAEARAENAADEVENEASTSKDPQARRGAALSAPVTSDLVVGTEEEAAPENLSEESEASETNASDSAPGSEAQSGALLEEALRSAPDRAATELAPHPPQQQSLVTIGPEAAEEMTGRIPGRGYSRPEKDDWQADSDLPSVVPRAPIRDESITAFRKNVGDNSRSMLFLLVGIAALALFAVFYWGKEAAPELTEGAQQRISYKEIARMTEVELKAKKAESTKPALVEPVDVAVETSNDQLKRGRLELKTTPPLVASTLFDTEELNFGRTPIAVDLKPGKYRIRLSDAEKRINVYREYTIKPGGVYRETVELIPGSLELTAPKGAEVYLDGIFLGKAPIPKTVVYEGKHQLKVSNKGKSWSKWFDAAPGAANEINVVQK